MYIYATEEHERRVLSKLQRGLTGLTAVGSWCESWNMKVNEGKTRAIYFSGRRRITRDDFQLNGRNTPFVNNAENLGVIFDMGMTYRLHIETTVAKALGTYMRTYSIFNSKHLSTNIKLIVFRALIRSIMIYACLTRELAADICLMKLQGLKNRFLRSIGDIDRRTAVRVSHVAFKIPYVYDYMPKLCRR
jgi:hypothetical protein